jgi:hypothetical protein
MTRIWTALLIVNAAWALHLVVSYFLAWAACVNDPGWLLVLRHLTTVVAAVTGLAALWQAYRASTSPGPTPPAGTQGATWATEYGFLARLALALSAMLLLGVLMAGAANLILPACQ